MGWIITFGILVLLAVLPLGVSAGYYASGGYVKILLGPFHYTLYPRKPGRTKAKPKQAPPKKTAPSQPQPKPETQSGGSLSDFLPLLEVLLDFLSTFRRKLRVNRLELNLVLAGEDPCDLALNYSRAWAMAGNLVSALERAFVVRKRHIDVECDFVAEQTRIAARLDCTITLGRLLSLVTVTGIRVLREYLKIRKNRKAVN